MSQKIKYKSEWVDIKNAIRLFDDAEDLIKAASENKIKTRGKIVDNIFPQFSESYTNIPPDTWNDFDFLDYNFSLEQPLHVNCDGVFRNYHHIQINKNELLLLISNQKHSGSSNELQDAIKKIFIELYLERTDSSFPSAPETFNKIESIKNNITCITKIDRKPDGKKSIWWKTAEGTNTSMSFSRLEKFLSEIRKQISELENSA